MEASRAHVPLKQQGRRQTLVFALALLTAGLAMRLVWLSYPPIITWDEVYFSHFAADYLTGEPFFDIHPPLGNMLIASALITARAQPGAFRFLSGEPYPPDYPYYAGRFLPALAGSLLPVLTFIIARHLSLSQMQSLFAGLLILFENALITESRLTLIDIFVPTFQLLGLLVFFLHRNTEPFSNSWWRRLVLTSLFAGLAMSVKWTGGGILLAVLIFSLYELRSGGRLANQQQWRIALARVTVMIGVSAAVYIAIFSLHFSLIPFDTQTPLLPWQISLTAPRNHKMPFAAAFIASHRRMTQIIAVTHPDSSRWYEWPFTNKPVRFFNETSGTLRSRIILAANPVVWLFGTLATLNGALWLIFRHGRKNNVSAPLLSHTIERDTLVLLFIFYLASWLPFAALKRELFLYHYFTAMIGSVLVGTFFLFHCFLSSGTSDNARVYRVKQLIPWGILSLAVVACAAIAPLSYGIAVPF